MSDTIRLNIKSKNFRAVVSKGNEDSSEFSEYSELLEKEKIENVHKMELENEFSKGFEAGKAETENILNNAHTQELLNQSEEFYKILKSFEENINSYENNFHKIVISVSKKIAEKILKREIEIKSTIEEIIEKNLSKIAGANEIVIKLNSTELKVIEKTSKVKMNEMGISKIRFEANENIKKGGCLIETEIGNLDARIDSQLNEIIKELENKLTKNTL